MKFGCQQFCSSISNQWELWQTARILCSMKVSTEIVPFQQ